MIHVIPIDDSREHDRSPGCWCGARVEWLDDDGRALGEPVAIHHAADLREAYEHATGDPHPDGKHWGVFEECQ